MFLWWFLSFLSCQTGPSLEDVSPREVPAGEIISVRGRGITGVSRISLVPTGGTGAVDLQEIRAENERADGRVPRDTTPGTYDVVVVVDDVAAGLGAAVVIEKPKEDVPCAGLYTANTQLSLARKRVIVDRFYRDGTRETVSLSTDDITKVEHEMRESESGMCSVILLRKADGTAVVFDDDAKIALRERAQKIARDLGKPFEDRPVD